MILEDATHEAFRHWPSELTHGSGKPIIAACELCGEFRITRKSDYHTFCGSCMHKGKHLTDKTKAKLSAVHIGTHHTKETKAKISKNHADFCGEKHPMFNKHHTEESKALISAAKKGMFFGENSPHWKGGKKVTWARSAAKRKRQLGYKLLMPLNEGEVGHHVTNEFVIGIQKAVHQHFHGHRRKKHRTLVLQWLKVNDKKKYKIVLCVLAKEILK